MRVGTAVKLTYADLTFGRRPYFRCPRCDERCSLLYLDDIVCGRCVGLRYLSESLGASARLQDRLERARLALGLDEHGQAQRPKWMHYDTWLRMWQRYWDAQEAIARSLTAPAPQAGIGQSP